MKLKPPTMRKGKHPTWCGPTALSILTGRTINYCAKLIAKRRNRRGWYYGKGTSKQIKGVNNHDMKLALQAMGFDMIQHHEGFGKTLRAYMAARGGPTWKGLMLINVTNHYVVACKDRVSDNQQHDAHYTEHRCSRKKIERMWLITRRR